MRRIQMENGQPKNDEIIAPTDRVAKCAEEKNILRGLREERPSSRTNEYATTFNILSSENPDENSITEASIESRLYSAKATIHEVPEAILRFFTSNSSKGAFRRHTLRRDHMMMETKGKCVDKQIVLWRNIKGYGKVEVTCMYTHLAKIETLHCAAQNVTFVSHPPHTHTHTRRPCKDEYFLRRSVSD